MFCKEIDVSIFSIRWWLINDVKTHFTRLAPLTGQAVHTHFLINDVCTRGVKDY